MRRSEREIDVNRKSTAKRGRTNVKKLDSLKDSEIDYSEIPELPDDLAESAEWFMPAPKALLSLRLDADVIEWFKQQGSGYQSRMNAVLKAYMLKAGDPKEVRETRARYGARRQESNRRK